MVHLPGRKENCEKSQNINLNYDKLLTLTKMPATENPPGIASSFSEGPRGAGIWDLGARSSELFRRRDFASQKFFKAIFDCGQLNTHKVDGPKRAKGRETPNKTVAKDELHLDAVGFN